MTSGELLERALSQLGLGTHYRMGGGKTTPTGRDCRDDAGGCDCSAYVCWCFRLPKFQAAEMAWLEELNGGWLNSDGIWTDARGQGGAFGPATSGFFTEVDEAEPGAVVVYPAKWVSGVDGPKVGHVGIVTGVAGDRSYDVVHCSAGNWRGGSDAIMETDSFVFEKQAATIFAWASSVKHA